MLNLKLILIPLLFSMMSCSQHQRREEPVRKNIRQDLTDLKKNKKENRYLKKKISKIYEVAKQCGTIVKDDGKNAQLSFYRKVYENQKEEVSRLRILNELLQGRVKNLGIKNGKLKEAALVEKVPLRKISSVPPEITVLSKGSFSGQRKVSELLHRAQKNIAYKKYRKALENISIVLERTPTNIRAWRLKGTVSYLMGNFEVAKSSWVKTLELDPYDVFAHKYLKKAKEKVRQVTKKSNGSNSGLVPILVGSENE